MWSSMEGYETEKVPFLQWPVMDQLTANSQQIATSLKEP